MNCYNRGRAISRVLVEGGGARASSSIDSVKLYYSERRVYRLTLRVGLGQARNHRRSTRRRRTKGTGALEGVTCRELLDYLKVTGVVSRER